MVKTTLLSSAVLYTTAVLYSLEVRLRRTGILCPYQTNTTKMILGYDPELTNIIKPSFGVVPHMRLKGISCHWAIRAEDPIGAAIFVLADSQEHWFLKLVTNPHAPCSSARVEPIPRFTWAEKFQQKTLWMFSCRLIDSCCQSVRSTDSCGTALP